MTLKKKDIICHLLLVLFAILTGKSLAEDDDQCIVQSTSGTDFMFGIPGPYGGFSYIRILLTTDSSADVRVTAPFLNFDKHFVFSKHTTIDIGTSIQHIAEGPQFKGIEIHSDALIWAAVILGSGNNFEGFLLAPIPVLSTKYNIASYLPFPQNNYYFSEFLVVGTESDTTVNIEFPKSFTPSPDGLISFQLQKYETYLYRSLSDVTGAVVTSDKPVTVVSGTSCAQIPEGQGVCQYIVEQMLPTNVYEFQFILPAFPITVNYYARIFAANDNTEVNFYNSTTHYSRFINEREMLEGHFFKEPTVLIADKPISVILYSENPFMVTAQALTQFQSEYNFVLQKIYTSGNKLAVTIKSADLPDLYLDGSRTAIDAAKKVQVAAPLQEYTTVYIDISQPTIHRLHHARNQKFGALLYAVYSNIAYGIPLQLTLTNTACYQGNDTNTTIAYPNQGHLGSQINYKPTGKGVHCFNCEDMTHLKYCDQVTTCTKEDEVCYVQSYSKSLNTVKYRSGCIDKHRCTVHAHQHGCIECCNGSYCNTYGCGDNGLLGLHNRGPFCFDCRHQGANDVCKTVQLCSVTEICMIEKYKWGNDDSHYIMGCTDAQTCSDRRRSLTNTSMERTDRNVPVCSSCCDTDLCNVNCNVNQSPNIIG